MYVCMYLYIYYINHIIHNISYIIYIYLTDSTTWGCYLKMGDYPDPDTSHGEDFPWDLMGFADRQTNSSWLVVFRHPSEKYDFVSWDDDIPNHQSASKIFVFNGSWLSHPQKDKTHESFGNFSLMNTKYNLCHYLFGGFNQPLWKNMTSSMEHKTCIFETFETTNH